MALKNAILQDPLFCRFNLKPYIPWRGKIEEKTAQLCKTFNGRKCSGDLSLYFLAQFKLNVYKLRKMLKCIPHICHIYHILDMWRKNCHVEKFQICMHDICREIWNFSTCWVISNFSTWQMWRNLKFLHILHHCCYQEKWIYPWYNAKLTLTLFSFANPITVAYGD